MTPNVGSFTERKIYHGTCSGEYQLTNKLAR